MKFSVTMTGKKVIQMSNFRITNFMSISLIDIVSRRYSILLPLCNFFRHKHFNALFISNRNDNLDYNLFKSEETLNNES